MVDIIVWIVALIVIPFVSYHLFGLMLDYHTNKLIKESEEKRMREQEKKAIEQ